MIINNGEIIAYLQKDDSSLILNQVYNIGDDGEINGIIELDTCISGGF